MRGAGRGGAGRGGVGWGGVGKAGSGAQVRVKRAGHGEEGRGDKSQGGARGQGRVRKAGLGGKSQGGEWSTGYRVEHRAWLGGSTSCCRSACVLFLPSPTPPLILPLHHPCAPCRRRLIQGRCMPKRPWPACCWGKPCWRRCSGGARWACQRRRSAAAALHCTAAAALHCTAAAALRCTAAAALRRTATGGCASYPYRPPVNM